MPSLIVVGKKRTEEFPLTDAVTVIGRDKGVNLELSDFKASRRHALLVQTEVGCFVKDLGSRNGVSLNANRLTSRGQLPVKNGDVISLGSTTLVFKDLSEAGVDSAVVNSVVLASGPPGADSPADSRSTPQPTPQPAPPVREVAKPPSVVMRTPAARRPALRGEAEALLMQALERADRERSFYRWLSLGLIAVLVIVLLLLLVVALRNPGATAPAPAPPVAEGVPPSVELPTAAFELDSRRFTNGVHGVLADRCAGCHAAVGQAGELVLVSGSDAESVRANRSAAARYVIAGHPEHSALLLKPRSPGHGGGVVLPEGDPDYAQLYAWVTTAPTTALPPPVSSSPNRSPVLAVGPLPEELAAGEELLLDASGSSDPDGDKLNYRWVLTASPADSKATLGGAEAVVVFVPDVAGDYEATVIVHDGREDVRVAVPFRVGIERAARAGARLAVFERLTQRSLDPAEGERLEALSREELARQLLAEEGFFVGWWEAELRHLGLTGTSRPKGEPWDSMPSRLQRAANTPVDVLFALAVGSKWNRRYAGRDAFVAAVVDRLLAASVDDKAREAAARLYDGYPATYLGVEGSSSADLVKITLDDPRALEGVLRRGLTWIGQRAPSEPDVREAVSWTQGRPERVFEALARWASRDL